jgi:O-antigen ligase
VTRGAITTKAAASARAAAVVVVLLALAVIVPGLNPADPVTVVMAGSALAALALLVPAIRAAREAGDLDASTGLTLAVGWLISLPIVIAVFAGSVDRRLDPSRDLVPVLPGWYETASHVAQGLLIALAAALVVRRLISGTRRVTLHTAGLLAIVLWALAWLASGLEGGPLLNLPGATLLACLLAATVLPRGRGAAVGVGLFGVTLAIASGLLAAFQFDLASVPCRDYCVLGSALTGALPNENLLGTALLVALPFAYLGFRGRPRTWLVAYLAFMAFATGSRGAMLGVVIVIGALLVVRPRLDADRRTPVRAAAAGLLLTAVLLPSAYVVAHDWTSSSYSLDDRPSLWRVASEYTEDAPVFGYGPDRWGNLYTQTGEIPLAAQHSTHNQFVDVLFTAGWVGVALLAAIVVAMLWSAGYARPAVLVVLATVFLIGIAERAWQIGAADFASFSLIALILLGPTRVAAREAPATEQPARARPRPAVAVPSG